MSDVRRTVHHGDVVVADGFTGDGSRMKGPVALADAILDALYWVSKLQTYEGGND